MLINTTDIVFFFVIFVCFTLLLLEVKSIINLNKQGYDMGQVPIKPKNLKNPSRNSK